MAEGQGTSVNIVQGVRHFLKYTLSEITEITFEITRITPKMKLEIAENLS